MLAGVETWLKDEAVKIASATALTVASFLLGRFWLSVLQPWLQSLWWQGIHLDESYVGEFTLPGAAGPANDFIELKQKASRVTGTIVVPKSRWNKYEFTARLENNILKGTWKVAGKATDATGSFLMLVKPGSRELNGWCIEPIDGEVVAYKYKWTVRHLSDGHNEKP